MMAAPEGSIPSSASKPGFFTGIKLKDQPYFYKADPESS
jgi:hypothetical protein